MQKVLVYGYYKNPPNLGDHLFTTAFKHLFPNIDFQFTDHITEEMLKGISIVIFGGGSLLEGAPDITKSALSLIEKLPIFYISVGAETKIHTIHQKLMSMAKLIAIRSYNLDEIRKINHNTIYIPDLVYSLQDQVVRVDKKPNSILFIPNITVVPRYYDAHWKHVSWDRFVLEMAQVLDGLIYDGYTITPYAMSASQQENDNWAFVEIVNRMHYKPYLPSENYLDIPSITKLFSQYELIITQRYHGAILAEMAGTNYICLHHHDKLKNTSYNIGTFSSYYEMSKDKLFKEIDLSLQNKNFLPLKSNIFKELVSSVEKCLNDLSV